LLLCADVTYSFDLLQPLASSARILASLPKKEESSNDTTVLFVAHRLRGHVTFEMVEDAFTNQGFEKCDEIDGSWPDMKILIFSAVLAVK